MCAETIAAWFANAGATTAAGSTAAGTTAAATGSTAAGATAATTAGTTAAGSAASGAAGATAAKAGLGAKLANTAIVASALAPVLFRPSMPKAPGSAQVESAADAAARARRKAQMQARGAYGKSATNSTGGAGVNPVTSGTKTLLGA